MAFRAVTGLRSTRRVRLGLGFAVGLALATGACGDPLLPAGFEGPPAAAVSGNVVGEPQDGRDAMRPRLAMEWLVGVGTGRPTLLQQPVEYQRSARLQHDFDIDLRSPADAASFGDPTPSGAPGVRLAVGKLTYFDDRVPDDALDRRCSGAGCDEVKAISAHFVVFLDKPLPCPHPLGMANGRAARPRLTAGYHYFTFEGGELYEIGPTEAVQLNAIELADTPDPTDELAAFVAALLRTLRNDVPGTPTGC